MMDIFCEYIVKKKVELLDVLKVIGIWLLAFLLSTVDILFVTQILGGGISLAIVAILFYFAFLLSKIIYVEFEYALTNNEMDVDKIIGRSRRKRVITVDFKTIELCASVNDAMYKNQYENTSSITKTINVTGKSDYDVYFVDFVDSSGKIRVLFQPTDKMKDALKLINPRAIHIV